jgi:hypothetical protein
MSRAIVITGASSGIGVTALAAIVQRYFEDVDAFEANARS